ncbi:hypothetical protein DFS33DRAFT_1294196 [Desarmillaria ectypa]|nr:hypothetical protein DFS33DRAFT_1294196 [Desarmillaria ectypa]
MDSSEFSPAFHTQVSQRFQALIWACLDSDLTRSAVFYAERYFAIHTATHDARHLYATALLREGQTYSALAIVNIARQQQCSGCLELKAKCCTTLGRYRQAREALEETLQDPTYRPSSSTGPRTARQFPDDAALHCRAGTMALKGNLQDKAAISFQQALSLNPYIWEAFEGLCSLGVVPDIDQLFPPRPIPTRRALQEEQIPPKASIPVTTGAAFFTPEATNTGNLFRPWKPVPILQTQLFRMSPPGIPMNSNTQPTPAPENLQHRHTRTQSSVQASSSQTHFSRPLSSADEAGPVPKKLRSTRQTEPSKHSKSLKQNGDDPQKKARARQGFHFSNLFSSSSRRSQQSSRISAVPGKLGNSASNATRRSTRLLSGTKQAKPSTRDRRRQQTHGRSHSFESDGEDDAYAGEVGYSPSPPPNAHSPRSERSPSPGPWTSTTQDAYEMELADNYVYDLMRQFAIATRALTLFDSARCLDELMQLPEEHQKTPWVLSLIGRAHYEKADYGAAERAFKALRTSDPYRLWDMEVYSTLLWYLQSHVELSFLAQELLNINPRSAQAWIAIGNLFSLQKDRPQALTCFKRAAQMDPSCAYAFTLSGHESIDEDVDKAINFFQSALRVDPRHYNAWYGLGSCYLRMSKIRLAEYHYRKANAIHPNNAVLLGCVGMAVERRGDRKTALQIFNEAIDISPENALVRYRRAKILISMKKYERAIEDLEYLRKSTPEESNVVFQLARAYRLVGDEVKSAQLLAVVRDIAPKSVNKIKKLLETVRDEMSDKMDEG